VARRQARTGSSPVRAQTQTGAEKPGSDGTLVPGPQARGVDPESNSDVEAGKEGELWIKGPEVMKGDVGNLGATASTIDSDGWLHTGDIAYVDPDGHTYIVDRLKELIKYKGFQVPPAELEALLLTHPGVADVAVIGVPDEEAGELPKAYIVRKPDSDVDAETLKEFVKGHLATYKQVRLVEFIDAIPKSASGKILRRVLRDQNK